MSNSNDYSPENLKYNFVFFFAESDFWQAIIGKELYDTDFCQVYKRAVKGSRLTEFLFRTHWAFSVNEKIDLPLKSLWYRRMYNQPFENGKPLCFVYMGANSIYHGLGFVDYVRKKDPRNRQVVMHQDLISKKINYDYNEYKKHFDLMMTYDKGEAEKYGIHYFPETVYSKLIPDEPVEIEYDAYFLGAAKDRLDDIMAVYYRLHDAGLRCKFVLAGVPEEKKIVSDGIEYTTGISYIENLENVRKSNCVAEVIQGGSGGITLRSREAIAYGKKLLTNCTDIEAGWFNNGQLSVFSSPDSIDISFLREKGGAYPTKIDMNPMKRLFDIQNELERRNNA